MKKIFWIAIAIGALYYFGNSSVRNIIGGAAHGTIRIGKAVATAVVTEASNPETKVLIENGKDLANKGIEGIKEIKIPAVVKETGITTPVTESIKDNSLEGK